MKTRTINIEKARLLMLPMVIKEVLVEMLRSYSTRKGNDCSVRYVLEDKLVPLYNKVGNSIVRKYFRKRKMPFNSNSIEITECPVTGTINVNWSCE